ncbi:MAG: hypothetical protein Tsb002_36160 [Wenzhouxiangellaceae bacterium]
MLTKPQAAAITGKPDNNGAPIIVEPSANQHSICHFGEYQLDLGSRCLSHRGQPVDIQNQVFDLLAYLAQRPGQIISKDELLQQVWASPYLSDAAVARAVMKARSAVNDDGKSQSIIKTIHGRGFMFVAPVQVETRSPPPLPAMRPRSGRWPLLALALLLIGLVTVWGWRAADTEPAARVLDDAVLIIMPFSNDTGATQYNWFEVGLSEACSEILQASTDLSVLTPGSIDKINGRSLEEAMAFIGARYGLSGSVRQTAERFELNYALHDRDSTVLRQGSITSPDPSLLARRLAERLVNELAGRHHALVSDIPLLNDMTALELYAQATQALYRDEPEHAEILLKAALTRVPGDPIVRGKLIAAQVDWNNLEATVTAYEDLLRDIAPGNSSLRLRILDRLGNIQWYASDVDGSMATMDQAMALTRTVHNDFLLANTLNDLSITLQSQGQFERAWQYASQALVEFQQLGDDYHASLVLSNLGYLADDRGQVLKARDLHQQALELRREHAFPQLIAASQYALARTYRRSGQFEQAAELLTTALATTQALNHAIDQFDNLEELAEVRMRQGQFAAAHQHLDAAQELARASDDQLGLAWSLEVRALLLLRQGQLSAVTERLEEAIRIQLDLGETQEANSARLSLAQAYLALGDTGAAQQQLQLTAPFASTNPGNIQLRHALLGAQLSLRRDGLSAALESYHDALEAAATTGASDLHAEHSLTLAMALINAHQYQAAADTLALARQWNSDYYRALQVQAALAEARGDTGLMQQTQSRLQREYPQVWALSGEKSAHTATD